jgi:hypothetical protein
MKNTSRANDAVIVGGICDIVSYEKYVIGPHFVYPHNVGFPDIVHAASNPKLQMSISNR